jgi:hypothetical protein
MTTKVMRSFEFGPEVLAAMDEVRPYHVSYRAVVENSVKWYRDRFLSSTVRLVESDKLVQYFSMVAATEHMLSGREPISQWDEHIVKLLEAAYQLGAINSDDLSSESVKYLAMIERLQGRLSELSENVKSGKL